MQADQCKFLEVVCGAQGIGGGGMNFGDDDAQLDRKNVHNHEASGCNYAPRAVLFDLEPGVIDSVSLPFGELFNPGNLVNQNVGAGIKWTKYKVFPLSLVPPGFPSVVRTTDFW